MCHIIVKEMIKITTEINSIFLSLNRFVHMDSESAADEAVRNINGTNVKGRSIKVEKSESKGPRKPSQKLFVGNLAEGIFS